MENEYQGILIAIHSPVQEVEGHAVALIAEAEPLEGSWAYVISATIDGDETNPVGIISGSVYPEEIPNSELGDLIEEDMLATKNIESIIQKNVRQCLIQNACTT